MKVRNPIVALSCRQPQHRSGFIGTGESLSFVKIRGKWVYLYRAVDGTGQTVDFRLSGKRDVGAAKAFFRKAIKTQGSAPRTITLDGYAASHRAVREMKTDGQLPADTKVRSSKYLNNLIEQDHRGVKLRIGPVRAFTPRWSCSIMLFKYFEDRSVVRFQRALSRGISRTARCDAA